MTVGANTSRLWIFYVPSGKEQCIKAYGIDTRTGAFMLREFSHVWTDHGVTAVAMIGAQSYFTGPTYTEAVDDGETYAEAISDGTTYRDVLSEVFTGERMALGDDQGNIYQYDSDLTTDDGNAVPAHNDSPVFDGGKPDQYKWWEGLSVTAKGGWLVVSYRTSDFETDDTGWVAFDPQVLTSEYIEYSFFFNETSKQIQFRFSNSAGSTYQVREFKILDPQLEDIL